MKALVVGGTGPTGPFIVKGLLQRGYEVSIFHRGNHEVEEIPPEVEHIHGDPHFRETIDEALQDRQFDLAVVTYGRLRLLASALEGKVERFVSIGGYVGLRGSMDPQAVSPAGMPILVAEDAPVVDSEEEMRVAYLIAKTEQQVLNSHPNATHFRYPAVYGPRQMGGGREWSIVRRILDRRPFIVLPDAGLSLITSGYAANMAHAVLLAVDQPEPSAGQIYHCGDEQQMTLHQIVEVITEALDYKWEIVCMPNSIAHPARYYAEESSHHQLMDISKVKRDLGYEDLYSARDALGMTVDWLVAHPPAPGKGGVGDPFDYPAEDRLVTAYKKSMEQLAAMPSTVSGEIAHPYAHPKEVGSGGDHRKR